MKCSLAFTLIELLIVMVIIALVAVISLPVISPVLRSSQLNSATDMLTGILGYARQAAISQNSPVEVRFYRYGSSSVPGEQPSNPASGKYRALQLFLVQSSGYTVFGKVQTLPSTIVIDSSTTYSSILYSPQPGAIPLPNLGMNYDYCAFRFRSDGSGGVWPTSSSVTYDTLTLHVISADDPSTSLPSNFSTINVDPFSGALTVYRP